LVTRRMYGEADDVRETAMVKSSRWVQGPAMSRIDVELSIRLPTQII
jgi:hypothetical protein